MILSNEIEITITNNYKYYEKLGYIIPKYKNKDGKIVAKIGEKIKVKIKDLPKSSQIKIKIKCDNPNCNKGEYEVSYEKYNRHIRDGDKYYCRKCACKLFNSGKNNYRWKNDLTYEEREESKQRNLNPKYHDFVLKVLSRDNYTCRCCETKIDAEVGCGVHHLNGYNWDKEHRYDETNGITLCKNCHDNFHSIYGRGNNTREQFEEWFGQAIELVKYEGELPSSRRIYCVEEDRIYDGYKELMKKIKCRNTGIYDVCNHKRKTLYGKHYMWESEYLKRKDDLNGQV